MPQRLVRAAVPIVWSLVLVTSAMAVPRQLHAQRRRDFVAVSGGGAIAWLSSSGASKSVSGPVVGLRYAVGVSDRSRAVLEYESQIFTLTDPTQDRHYTASFFLGALQYYPTDNFYIEPALGVQFRHWGGTARDVGADIGAAAGFAAGYEMSLSRNVTLAPEVQLHYSLVDPGSHVYAYGAGFHLVVARRF